ncbi:uncharacterized protein [Hetaerina americana]|uniref:uncharacterized protein isoform X2 n=1 Tax=Hetaerina americana TaxID=62018 RepID=UPI003A7F398F
MINFRTPSKSSRIIFLCSVANFINAADRVIMPITIVPMTDEFKWTLHWQGWILSAFPVGYFTSQIIGACAARRLGGRLVLLSAVLLWSATTAITPAIAPHSVVALVLCRALLGLGEGLGLPTMFQIFAQYVPLEERSRAIAYLVAAGSVGQTFASLVCPHIHWEVSFYTFGIFGLVWAIFWSLLVRENMIPFSDSSLETNSLEPLLTGASEEPSSQTPRFRGWKSQWNKDPVDGSESEATMESRSVHWSQFLCHWPLWGIYAAHFAMNWSSYIIMQWLPTYMARSLSASSLAISLSALPYLANSFVGIAAGHAADALISRRGWPVLSVRRLMTNLGLLGPAFSLLIFCSVNNLAVAVLLVSISMGFCACNSAGHLSNHAEIAPNHAGITFAISNTLATIPGILCGPMTAELVTSSRGRWFPVFVLAATVNLTGAVIYQSQSSASQII